MNLKTSIAALAAAAGLLAAPGTAAAQRATVKAWMDSTYVVIGSPTTIHLEASVPEGQAIAFPALEPQGVRAYDDSLAYVLEYGAQPAVDTLSRTGGLITLREDIEVFAFDSATLYIPPFRFACGGDTLLSASLALKVVVPFDVEVDPEKFCDIKGVMTPRFVLWDYAAWVLWPLAVLLAVVGVVLLVRRLARRRRAVAEEPAPVSVVPPHVAALEALEALDGRKLWQNGQSKRYHTELTDILRTYIARRFGVAAPEMTTDEIIDSLFELAETQKSSLASLRQVLTLADLVKFAKYEPLADEHQLSSVNARMFVTQTQATEVPPAPDGADARP